MYLMKLNEEALERLRKATKEKQVILENPVIVKTKTEQYPLIIDKGEYEDYITPCMVELNLAEVEEVYLIMDIRSSAIYDVLSHTEKYDIVEFDLTCLDSLIESI